MIWSRTLRTGLLVAAGVLLTGCHGGGPVTGPSSGPTATPAPASTGAGPAGSATPGPSAAPTAGPSRPAPSLPPEPTTTNTLPPPPEPTAPAPKTAGPLTAKDLPVPAGWQRVVREGGVEEGYRGNGTWVHGRDPRYAAQDTITIGCATITRDDYHDPVAALEGTYGKRGATDSRPGVGLVMQFKSGADARYYYGQYVRQVRACNDPNGQVVATVLASPLGLIDHRTYDGSTDWTEVAAVHGARATFVILTDPGHRIGRRQAEAILRAIPH